MNTYINRVINYLELTKIIDSSLMLNAKIFGYSKSNINFEDPINKKTP